MAYLLTLLLILAAFVTVGIFADHVPSARFDALMERLFGTES